jgi:hypothetical protein
VIYDTESGITIGDALRIITPKKMDMRRFVFLRKETYFIKIDSDTLLQDFLLRLLLRICWPLDYLYS